MEKKHKNALFLRSVECLPHCCLGRWEWAPGSYVNVPFDDLQLLRIKLATSKKKAHVGYFSPFVKITKVEKVADGER